MDQTINVHIFLTIDKQAHHHRGPWTADQT